MTALTCHTKALVLAREFKIYTQKNKDQEQERKSTCLSFTFAALNTRASESDGSVCGWY